MAPTELPNRSDEEDSPCIDPCDRSEVAARSVRSCRILIIDDEPLFGQTMSLLLGMEHEVTVERTGHAALTRLLSGVRYDLVLCDVSLPDIAGPTLYEQIAESDPELAQRFVFITGGAFTASSRDFLGRYQGRRLDKPFTMTDLERMLENQPRLSA